MPWCHVAERQDVLLKSFRRMVDAGVANGDLHLVGNVTAPIRRTKILIEQLHRTVETGSPIGVSTSLPFDTLRRECQAASESLARHGIRLRTKSANPASKSISACRSSKRCRPERCLWCTTVAAPARSSRATSTASCGAIRMSSITQTRQPCGGLPALREAITSSGRGGQPEVRRAGISRPHGCRHRKSAPRRPGWNAPPPEGG